MSLLTPERVPVKVYKWDDVGAPALDKTAGCMMTIFKACLVTGYGTKEPAGWTMPYEDTAAKVKVMRPEVGPRTDFYLRLSADTGTEMAAQVYQNMTDVNTGDLKLQCNTGFKYAKSTITKWFLVASTRGFWFFCDQTGTNRDKNGAFFYCGDTMEGIEGDRQVFLSHTAGTSSSPYYANILGYLGTASILDGGASDYDKGAMLSEMNVVSSVRPIAIANSMRALSSDDVVAPIIVIGSGKTYTLPGVYIPLKGAVYNNLAPVTVGDSDITVNCLNFATGSNGNSNLYVSIDYWR